MFVYLRGKLDSITFRLNLVAFFSGLENRKLRFPLEIYKLTSFSSWKFNASIFSHNLLIFLVIFKNLKRESSVRSFKLTAWFFIYNELIYFYISRKLKASVFSRFLVSFILVPEHLKLPFFQFSKIQSYNFPPQFTNILFFRFWKCKASVNNLLICSFFST